ncbi:hypothetical protein BDW68DRAFT_21205 [Aspergillus falconensis]
MASLRKACLNCTASKRKCVIRIPKCTRCAQRGLECMYDLEPLSTPVAQLRESPKFTWNPSICESPGYCLIKRVRTRPCNVDPAICQPGHGDALEVLRLGYQSVPGLFRAEKPALFVHPKLHLHDSYNHLAALVETEKDGSHQSFNRLIELDINVVPIKEALTALQALLIHLATFTLNGQNVECFLDLLVDWSQALLASAQTRLPPDPSPWQMWLFGESVRRTIVMAYALAMAINSFTNGYCTYWMFLESLPFDRRAGLWMAESPQAWIAAAGVRFGEEVGEQLISFHEFGESQAGAEDDFRGDTFLGLVAISHGK